MQTLIDLRVLGVEIGKGEQKSAKAFSAEIKRLADEIEAELAALRAENEKYKTALINANSIVRADASVDVRLERVARIVAEVLK